MEFWQYLEKKRNIDHDFPPPTQQIVGAENNKYNSFGRQQLDSFFLKKIVA